MLPRLIFLVGLYLTLDVANPMIPGALAFSVEDSVEARMAPRLRADDVATASARAAECLKRVVELPVRSQVVVRAARLCRTHAPRLRLPAAAPALSPDDD
jgi:hypothetical protein